VSPERTVTYVVRVERPVVLERLGFLVRRVDVDAEALVVRFFVVAVALAEAPPLARVRPARFRQTGQVRRRTGRTWGTRTLAERANGSRH